MTPDKRGKFLCAQGIRNQHQDIGLTPLAPIPENVLNRAPTPTGDGTYI